ncbi:uncharacterized protein [Nicotiana tomentosiformis]|uniref:uncharacterized protein n=1 Tax=Nicotiana tomentosiformis TaxID=4098 RepID=UPI00388C87C4
MTNNNGNQTVPMKFITEDVPVLPDETPENERFLVIESWKHSDFLCKNYILSGLEDNVYNVYSNMETSKQLWIALERKYKTEDAGLKKFIAAKFLDYKMVDNKSVITQVQELQVIIHDLLAEGISQINTNVESINYIVSTNKIFTEGLVINEAFQVAAMIEKLPPLWKDFKNYLKHKRKEMSLEDLIVRKRKKAYGPKSNPSKKRFNGNYYNYGKAEHRSADCCAPKKHKKKGQANMVEKHEDIYDLCAMLSECNLVGNPKEWWIDSGATRHVCAIREAFATYALVGPEEMLSMGNSAMAKIEGSGKIFL